MEGIELSKVRALTSNLSDKDIKLLDLILQEDSKLLSRGTGILKESAELVGRTSEIELMEHQVLPILTMQITKRVLNGFSAGIGKTFSSCGAYALYRMKCIKEGITPKKLLLVTVTSHVSGMEYDFRRGGVNLLALHGGGNVKVRRDLNKAEEESSTGNIEDDYDGIVTNWSTLKTNEFLRYYMKNKDKYDFAILDETTEVMNSKSEIYKVTDMILNKYQKGLTYVMFLNGTNFNTGIYDIYNQINLLIPRLIPSKKYIEDRYVVRESKDIWKTQIVNNRGRAGFNRERSRIKEIVDYKNQEEFKEKLRYYIITKNKDEISDKLPKMTYKLFMLPIPTKIQNRLKDERAIDRVHLLNSPVTRDPKFKMTRTDYPKLDFLIDRVKETKDDRPVIYSLNKGVMTVIKDLLTKEGFRVGILNGEIGAEEKSEIIESFNNYELDVLILNVDKAINLPTSDRIIFYSVPSLPLLTTQIMARIDRNNYEDPKFYDFLCYESSIEIGYIVRLGSFREEQGQVLTGQSSSKVYAELVNQLKEYYSEEDLNKATEIIKKRESKTKWEEVEDELYKHLGLY